MYTPHPTPAADECITCTRTLCELPHTCGKDECITCGDWIEIHDGQPVCKSGCEQPHTFSGTARS